MPDIDLADVDVRALNQCLHDLDAGTNEREWRLLQPRGKHAVAVGLTAPVRVSVLGHVGFYCGGMNKEAEIIIEGHAGPGVGENMMSGVVRVRGNASQMAGASGHGGLLVIEGEAAARCGISMKGIDIAVQGSVGNMSAFLGQKGNLVVLGDAGQDLGDSIYEARVFVRGSVGSLGADCVEKEMRLEHVELLEQLLARAGFNANPRAFRRYGSARRLYNFNIDHAASY
jgi:glutamate synthase domain-containing protein 3